MTSTQRLAVRKSAVLLLVFALTALEAFLAWLVELPDMLILPVAGAWGYWGLPWVIERLAPWTRA